MTPNDLITEIRSIVSDEASVQWTDAELRTYMLDAELRIVRDHPESQYHTRLTNSVPTLLASNSDSFTIGPAWRNAIVHYVAFRLFLEGSEDTWNATNAKMHFDMFEGSTK
jgi:hypothetical protein